MSNLEVLKIKNVLTKDQLYKELNYVNATRKSRLHYSEWILTNLNLLSYLVEILFDVDDEISCRAAWVFEFIIIDDIDLIIPFLDRFSNNISSVHFDSAIRPVAKICEYLVKMYFSKKDNQIKKYLTEAHKEKIMEACFDWMINDEKTAPKAYAMNTLFLLGKETSWVHPELKIILERDYQTQSAGYKARAKHILKKIKN